MACALVDARGAPEGARPEALDGGALVDEGLAHPQLVRAELVVRLGVRDRRVQQLEDVVRDGARGVREDRPSLLDLLATDVVHDESGLARGAAHVLGAGAHDDGTVRAARSGPALAGGDLGGAAPAGGAGGGGPTHRGLALPGRV